MLLQRAGLKPQCKVKEITIPDPFFPPEPSGSNAEKRERETTKIATSMVTNAQKQQRLAEVEKDQAESYFEKATTSFEDRLKAIASEIFKLNSLNEKQ